MTRPVRTRAERNAAVSRLVTSLYRVGQTEATAIIEQRRNRDDRDRDRDADDTAR